MMVALKAFNSYMELADSLLLYQLFKELLQNKANKLIRRLYSAYIKKGEEKFTINLLEKSSKNVGEEKRDLLNKLIVSCKEETKYIELSYKSFGKYDPLRLVLLDLPYNILSDDIPLEDYDKNEGEPFWMRPEYILEHYSGK